MVLIGSMWMRIPVVAKRSQISWSLSSVNTFLMRLWAQLLASVSHCVIVLCHTDVISKGEVAEVSLFRNHSLVTERNSPSLMGAASCQKSFFLWIHQPK